MNFVIIGYDQKGYWERRPQEERAQAISTHQNALNELIVQRTMTQRGRLVFASVGLRPGDEPTTIRMKDSKWLTVDGPFSESKEVVGGFGVVNFGSKEEAVEWAKAERAGFESSLAEIRPIEEMWWLDQGVGQTDRTRFILSLCVDEQRWGRISQAERERIARHHQQVGLQYTQKGLGFTPVCLGYINLRPNSESVVIRKDAGKYSVSDGPIARTNETIRGLMVMDCTSKDDALDWARKLIVHEAEAIEVRAAFGSWFIYHAQIGR